MRLDAVARYLQDVAQEDADDAGWPTSVGWFIRRSVVTVRRFPRLGENLEAVTFCSGTASHWAERTTTMTGDAGGSLQAVAVWIAVEARSGRPTRLGESFESVYMPSAAGRRVSAKLHLAPPPLAARESARCWPLRTSDLDVWGHVNNAVSWTAIEDELDGLGWLPSRVELEHNDAISLEDAPRLASVVSVGRLHVWLVAGERVLTSALLHHDAGQPAD
jgi:acyl-ACP thioesterase